MKRYIIDREVTLTTADFEANPRALRGHPNGTRLILVRDDGTVISHIETHRVEAHADPDDDEAELHWAVCIGVIALGEWARGCAWDQLDECCTACWGLGIRGPCRRHRR